MRAYVCVCACVRACMGACVHACVSDDKLSAAQFATPRRHVDIDRHENHSPLVQSEMFVEVSSVFLAISFPECRELAKATYRGAAPPFDACAPSFDFCAHSFKCPLKSSATLQKDGPSPSASFGPAPRPA